MGNFSGEQAIASGFRVIFRRPAVIGAWGLFYLVLGIGPSLLWLAPMWSQSMGHNTDPTAALAAMSKMSVWFPVIWLLGLAHAAIGYSAVYRAVLTPEDRQYFYLRLSRRELWVGLTLLALVLLIIACILIAGITVTVLAHAVPGLVTFLLTCATIFAAIWLAMRFSLATPMAFAEERFVLMESWRLTEGLAWKLFGVAFCLVAILLAIELALMVPVMVILGLTGVFTHMAQATAAGAMPAYPLPVIGLYLLILPVLGAMMYAVLGAPWANIYQQLTGPKTGAAL